MLTLTSEKVKKMLMGVYNKFNKQRNQHNGQTTTTRCCLTTTIATTATTATTTATTATTTTSWVPSRKYFLKGHQILVLKLFISVIFQILTNPTSSGTTSRFGLLLLTDFVVATGGKSTTEQQRKGYRGKDIGLKIMDEKNNNINIEKKTM